MVNFIIFLILLPFLILIGYFIYFSCKCVIVISKVPVLNIRFLTYSLIGPLSLLFISKNSKSKIDDNMMMYNKYFIKSLLFLLGCMIYGLLLRYMFQYF